MIHSFSVEGLNNKWDYEMQFHEDLNIFTGRNGSGKTTVLKLLWYCYSGNFDRIRSEIVFRSLSMRTSEFDLTINTLAEGRPSPAMQVVLHTSKGEIHTPSLPPDSDYLGSLLSGVSYPDEVYAPTKNEVLELGRSSVFFPTFRRIEGGYTFNRRRRRYPGEAQLQEAIADFSEALEQGNHKFVSSVSTDDIVTLLTSKYAEISEQTNSLHIQLSESITETIQDYEKVAHSESDRESLEEAKITIDKIQTRILQIQTKRESLFKPFIVLTALVRKILQHKGIRITEAINFGETKEGISSDKLSAGEKQMLSFLCYNAFSADSCIFIDEPEISLHVDWQRSLFPTLVEQSTSNQFFVSTHSPFIYSKFTDKEIVLNRDKGATSNESLFS